jgi:catechol 2,3-dioxygenase-like lactoylglutathione lyase family enzyme
VYSIPSAFKSLGEVALRVNNLPEMSWFYQEVLGLEVLGASGSAVLLKIADDFGGHTQVLGLFDRSVLVGPERTTVDHIAFTIALPDYESERTRLEGLVWWLRRRTTRGSSGGRSTFTIPKKTRLNSFVSTRAWAGRSRP